MKCSLLRYLLPTLNMSNHTRKIMATATITVLPLRTNEPSFPTASVLGVLYAQTIRRKTHEISTSERSASLTRSVWRSAARASTIISFIPASLAPTNVPAIPGMIAHNAQKPAVIPYEMYIAFIIVFFSYFSFRILSST